MASYCETHTSPTESRWLEALDYGDSFPVFGPTLRLLTRAALSEGRDRREHHTAEGRWIKTFWRMEQIF
jgi:hypothetical protein